MRYFVPLHIISHLAIYKAQSLHILLCTQTDDCLKVLSKFTESLVYQLSVLQYIVRGQNVNPMHGLRAFFVRMQTQRTTSATPQSHGYTAPEQLRSIYVGCFPRSPLAGRRSE